MFTGIISVALVLLYILGPKPTKPDLSSLQLPYYNPDLKALEDSLNRAEASLPLKPDNEARIIWETPFEKTPYSIVYLHGNAASQEEGDPVHEALAHRYGCNLFLARLADHGLKGDNPLMQFDAQTWMQSALDAIAVGKAIGDKVIVVSCSMGSISALYLASRYPDLIEGHVMMSPCIDMFDPRSFLLAGPWGLQIARQILGSEYYGWKAPGRAQQYWYTRYRIEELTRLKALINITMNKSTFSKIDDPLILLYYYKDENHQDNVVSVQRMKEMFLELKTPADHKKEVVLDDAGTHIIGSAIFNDHIESLWTPVSAFMEDVLHLTPVHDTDLISFIDP